MNNKIIVRSLSIASLFLFLSIYGFGAPKEAHAQTPCYTFAPATASTVSVNILTSSGQSQTISIPNQNPPSILQKIEFSAPNYLCAMFYNLQYPQLLYANFLPSGAAAIPFSTSPFTLNLPYAYTDGLGYNYGWLGWMDYAGLSDMGYIKSTEDAIIASIQSTHQFSINAGNNTGGAGGWGTSLGFSGNDISIYPPYGPLTMTAPATNCVALGGTGPLKVVFMRGKSWTGSVSDLIYQAENVVNNGYKAIDPYKTYIGQFSFYADLNNYDETTGTAPTSTCGKASESIFFGYNISSGSLAASGLTNGFTYYNFAAESGNLALYATDSGLSNDATRAAIIMHETGHAFAGLLDEYVLPSNQTTGTNPNLHTIDNISANNLNGLGNTENCTGNPSQAYRYSNSANPTYDGRLFGGYLNTGCTYLLSASVPSGMKRPTAYYRPSSISIMNAASGISGGAGWNTKFNIISCGYIVAAIQGQALTKTNAQSHWLPTDSTSPNGKGCYALDTTGQSEIPPVKPAPTAAGFTAASSGTNGGTVSGSGFTPTGNSIQLIPVATTAAIPSKTVEANAFSAFDFIANFFKNLIPAAHGQTTGTFYEIDDISSLDGTSLNFTVPTSTPDGTYTISVSALNSPWTATSYTIVVSGDGAGDTSTAVTGTTSTTTTTPPPTVSTNTYPATMAASAVYTCKSGYTLTSTNTCYQASVTTSVPASSYGASLGCPSNAPTYNSSMNTCQGTYGGLPLTAARVYTCPSGGTLSGSTCSIPASTSVTTASTIPATATYSCPTGYTLSGTTCTINTVATGVTAKTNGNGQINLTWSNNNVPNENVVCIERALGTSGTFNRVICLSPAIGTGVFPTTYTDTGLLPSQIYQYRINLGINNTVGGFGPYSAITKVTTSAAPTAPTLKAAAASASSINLTWTSNETNIVGYGVYLISSTQIVFVATSTAKSTTVSGLSAGTQYCYGVIASVNPTNNSAISKSACATTTGSTVATSTTSASTTPVTTPTTPTAPATTTPVTTTPPVTTPTTSGTVNATPTYTCPIGQVLNSTTLKCSRSGSPAGATAATVTYTCPSGYTLNSSTKTCTPPTTTATTPTSSGTVPAPTPVSTSPVITPPPTVSPVTTIPATKTYSCPTNQTLDAVAGTCSATTNRPVHGTPATTPASVQYSCPTGYTLNSATQTCSSVVSLQTSTSTTTASVWNAVMDWLSNLFK